MLNGFSFRSKKRSSPKSEEIFSILLEKKGDHHLECYWKTLLYTLSGWMLFTTPSYCYLKLCGMMVGNLRALHFFNHQPWTKIEKEKTTPLNNSQFSDATCWFTGRVSEKSTINPINQQARSSVDGVGDAGCAEEVAWKRGWSDASWKLEIPSDTKNTGKLIWNTIMELWFWPNKGFLGAKSVHFQGN